VRERARGYFRDGEWVRGMDLTNNTPHPFVRCCETV
jgi:hypothetical protein